MMLELDYKKLGLICGLECHQQLDTGKLFSRCPAYLKEESPEKTFLRKIRPVPSEQGEYDAAAIDAFRKNFTFTYNAFSDVNSLIETDEEPPKPADKEAMKTILEVALLCNSNVLDELFVMRKTIIDGSNVSGFQRTMLAAIGGKIKISNKEIGVQTIILEEDSARPVEKKEKEIIYSIDRLGFPLIELATDPEIESPEEALEAALKIGEIFRVTGKAKRGLGTIRQDVNISIKEGARVEVKGVQNIQLMAEYIKREIQRQVSLIEIKKELEKRNARKEELKGKFVSLTQLLNKSSSNLIQTNLKKQNVIYGVKLPKFRGLIGKELQPGRRLGTELSDYVKSKSYLKGILHSDELPNYGLTGKEVESINSIMKLEALDAFVLVIGPELEVIQGLEAVIERAMKAFEGVPKETRGALEDGNTEYQRPLAGAARMYPETDLRTIKVNEKELIELKKNLPLMAEERKQKYLKEFKLSEKLAEEMKLNNSARFFERMTEKGFDSTQVAVILTQDLTELKRENLNTDLLNEEKLESFFKALKEKKITKEVIKDVLRKWIEFPEKELSEVIASMNIAKADSNEIRKVIIEIIKRNESMIKEKKERALSALMGEAMKELKGKASGQEISNTLKKELMKAI